MQAHPDLLAHNAQFKRGIIALSDSVFSATGYAASNIHAVVGRSTLTMIDTTESTEAAGNILADLRQHTTKPVGRIIYTHAHRDHIGGASVFRDAGQPVIASAAFKSDLVALDDSKTAPDKALGRRTMQQFGINLAPQERVSLGCGPGDRPIRGLGAGFVPPTMSIDRDQEIDLDGVSARLILAPGETADHMIVWLPAERILFCGDNWYHAFPNLYAIRGTPYRDFDAWVGSLNLLIGLKPEILAPGHTQPVFGAENVRHVLSTTRDAIRFVITFTAKAMDRGASLDEIAATIRLPAELADKPWLREFYGKLSWSARAYATGTLGWYDGNPTNLGTIAPKARASHMATLAGGEDALLNAARATDDLQWRLELCDHLMALGRIEVKQLKAAAMIELAKAEINATARNTYISEAHRLAQDS